MKHFKILFTLIAFSSFLNASMLLDTRNICIEDFYFQNSNFYYLQSNTNTWNSLPITENTTTYKGNLNASTLMFGYTYDSTNNKCIPSDSYIFGMTSEDYYFLMALMGVIFGGVFMFFSVNAFVNIGGKR